MKILTKLMTLAFLSVMLFSCGSDDDPDYTLYDKSEIIGTQSNGTVKVSLGIAQVTPYTSNTANTIFSSSSDNNKLLLIVSSPSEIGGSIEASNFMKSVDDTYYIFNIANHTTGDRTGGEIPEYIKSWFSSYNITKIILRDLKTTDARYVKATKAISFTMSGKLEIYITDANGTVSKAVEDVITYEFSNLKK